MGEGCCKESRIRQICNCLLLYLLYNMYSICAGNDAEFRETYTCSMPAPRLPDISSDVVHIIHMTSFYIDMLIYDNERWGGGGGGGPKDC